MKFENETEWAIYAAAYVAWLERGVGYETRAAERAATNGRSVHWELYEIDESVWAIARAEAVVTIYRKGLPAHAERYK